MIRIMCDQDVQGLARAEGLMEKLIDIEALRGAGRIYIP